MSHVVNVAFPRGSCPIHHFGPPDDVSAPVVLQFADAFGPRPSQFKIAERLAAEGYRVLLPDPFYALIPYQPLNPESLFSGGEDRQRLPTMLAGLTYEVVLSDVRTLLDYAMAKWPDAPIAAVGYCMGGRYALTAAAQGKAVVAAASLHGSFLAPAEGDGPHCHFADVSASIYIGVASADPTFDGPEEGRLAAALRSANIRHTIEVYPDAGHGFVLDDLPVHNAQAAEHHWQRVSQQFSDAFSRCKK